MKANANWSAANSTVDIADLHVFGAYTDRFGIGPFFVDGTHRYSERLSCSVAFSLVWPGSSTVGVSFGGTSGSGLVWAGTFTSGRL